MALRIIGVDTPGGAGGSMPFQQQNIQAPDTTTQNLQQGDAAVTQSIETVKQSSETIAKAQQQTAAANAQKGGFGDALVDAMNTTGKLLDRWNGIKAGEKKVAAEGAEADISLQLNDAMFGLRDQLQKEGYQKGLINARDKVKQILLSNPNLSAEARKTLAAQAYRQLDDLDRDFFKNAYEDNKDIKRQEISQAEATLRIKSGQEAARLLATADKDNPEAINQAFDNIERRAEEISTQLNLDPMQRAYFKASTLKYVAELNDSTAKVREIAMSRLNNTVTAQNQYAGIEAAYQSGQLSYEEREYLKQQVKAQYPETTAAPVTQLDSLEEANKLANLQMALQEAKEKDFLKNYDQATLVEAETTAMAMELLNDESQVWKYEKTKNIDSQRVLARYKQLKEQIPKVQQGQRQLAAMQTRIASLTSQIDMIQRMSSMSFEQREKYKKAGINIPDPNSLGKLQSELSGLQQEYQTLDGTVGNTFRTLTNFGVEFDKNGNYQISPSKRAELDRIKDMQKKGYLTSPQLFREGRGGPGQQQPVAQLSKMDVGGQNVFVPFTAQHKNKVSFTSGFGTRVHPIYGTAKHHNGLDLAAPIGTPTTALRSGVVTRVEEMSGYGKVVEIKMSDGKYAFYTHLDSQSVKKGDRVAQGQVVGKVGNSGGSTGPHLHLAVFNSATDNQGIDPVGYLRTVQPEKGAAPSRGLGLPPQQGVPGRSQYEQGTQTAPLPAGAPPYGALLLPSGGYVWGGKVYRQGVGGTGAYKPMSLGVEKYINSARPMPGTKASNDIRDYAGRNNPNANYGYKVIAEDRQFAKALAATADRLGFPAQWLADIMAFETGGSFDPSIGNEIGATGLIQFMPDTAAGLGTSTSALARMTRTQQLRYVEKYFRQGIQEVGKFKRMDDVFAYIWGGGNLVKKPDSSRANISDGNISYTGYINRIGEHAGRKYAHGLDRGASRGTTHTRYYSSCATCQHQHQTQGKITPHKG